MITQAQVAGLLRWLMGLISGAMITKGWGDAAVWTTISGLVVGTVPFVWTLLAHSKFGTIAAAEAVPGTVAVLTTDSTLARNSDLPKTMTPAEANIKK